MPDQPLTPTRPIPTHTSTRLRVRYCECDPMGVVHHASYVPWLEQARTELLRDAGVTYKQLEAAGIFLVVAALELSYRRPGRYDDLIDIHCRVTAGSRVKIEHHYEARVVQRTGTDPAALAAAGDDLLLTARSTLVCVSRELRVSPLPDWLVPPPAAPSA